LKPEDPDSYRNRGIAKEQAGNLDGALSDWEKAALLGDREASKWVAMARPQATDLAVETMIAIHSRDPAVSPASNTDNPTTSPTKSNKSSTGTKIALRSNTNDVHLLFQLGTKSLREGRPEQAIANFTKILELTPQSAKAIFNRAVAKRQTGDLNGALKDYDSVIKISPKDNQAYRNRGIVKQLLGSQIGACADWGIASGLGDLEAREWIRDECR